MTRLLTVMSVAFAVFLTACAPVDPPKPVAVPEKNMSKFESSLPEGFVIPADEVGKRILREYGALYVARGVEVPRKVMFANEAEVKDFQSRTTPATEKMGEHSVTLQSKALEALLHARSEARATGKDITPRGSDASMRDYAGTVELWASRVEPGLNHWVAEGKLDKAEADRIRALSPFEQVPEILKLEERGVFFAKDLSKTILHSVAAPGTSQHLSMLAFDINEFNDKEVIAILNRNGWYQTVVSDLPHFTYLGASESELEVMGLIKMEDVGRVYWIPEI